MIKLIACVVTTISAVILMLGSISVSSAAEVLSDKCDILAPFAIADRYFYNAEHRRILEIANEPDLAKRRAASIKAVPALQRIVKEAQTKLGKATSETAMLEADLADLRVAADPSYEGRAKTIIKSFTTLRKTAATSAAADRMLSLATTDAYTIGLQLADADTVLDLAARHERVVGPSSRLVSFLASYIARDNPEVNPLPAEELLQVANQTLRIATPAGSARGIYEAEFAVLKSHLRAHNGDDAIKVAESLYPRSVDRLLHERRRFDAEGARHDVECWSTEQVIETVNETLAPTRSREELVEAYRYEALAAVTLGTIRTDAFGASIPFAKLAALKAADEANYRDLLRYFAARDLTPDVAKDGVPTEIQMALLGGAIHDEILIPAVARAYYREAEQWIREYPNLGAAQRLLVLSEVAEFAWKSGDVGHASALIAEIRQLELANPGADEITSLRGVRLVEAAYADAQLEDDRAATALTEAARIDSSSAEAVDLDLIKSHLRDEFCPPCGPAIAALLHRVLPQIADEREGISGGFLSDAELLLLMLTSESDAVDDSLREQATAYVTSSDAYKEWLNGPGRAIKLKANERVKFWLAASFVSSVDFDLDLARISKFLSARSIAEMREIGFPLFDAIAVHSSEFGGDSDMLSELDRFARALQQARYPSASRVVLEQIARLADPNLEIGSWTAPDQEARLRLATIFGSMHARLARYAFEDKRWEDADRELDAALAVMLPRLRQEWQFGNERAVVLYRSLQPALKLTAQLRLLLAVEPAAAAQLAGIEQKALSDLQYAMLGETALTMQSAVKRRILADPMLAEAVARRDLARLQSEELEVLEATVQSKIAWVTEDKRLELKDALNNAESDIAGLAKLPEDIAALTSADRVQIDRALREDEALVILHSGRSTLFGIVVRPGREIRFFTSKIGADELSRRVSQLRREAATFGGIDLVNARELYRVVLQPGEHELSGVGHAIVVADGPLAAVPWSMLITNEADGAMVATASGERRGAKSIVDETSQGTSMRLADQPWLIRRFPVSLSPSVRTMIAQRIDGSRSAAKLAFFGLGDPVLGGNRDSLDVGDVSRSRDGKVDTGLLADLRRLPETADELRALSSALGGTGDNLLLGPQATKAQLLSTSLTNYRVLAFATHGVLAGEVRGVSEPGLVLSGEKAGFADYLSLSEIMAMKIDADLVLLSACNTGGPDGRARAESMSGLARGFIAAGARQLMVTLWSIPSEPTTRLTTGAAIAIKENPTLGWPRAMQRSILSMIETPAAPGDDHPASWASFTLLGVGAQ